MRIAWCPAAVDTVSGPGDARQRPAPSLQTLVYDFSSTGLSFPSGCLVSDSIGSMLLLLKEVCA